MDLISMVLFPFGVFPSPGLVHGLDVYLRMKKWALEVQDLTFGSR